MESQAKMLRSGVRNRRRQAIEEDAQSTNEREVRTKRAEDRPARLIHFKTLPAKLDFEENYHKRRIIPGRIFLKKFLRKINFEYLERLESWGWMHFLTMDVEVFPNLVKYFYYNGKLEDVDDNYEPIPKTEADQGFHTFLEQTNFAVRDDDVWLALGSPVNMPNAPTFIKHFNFVKGSKIIMGDRRRTTLLKDTAELSFHNRILHLMVCQTINPRRGSYTNISKEDIWLMARIILGKPPNLHEFVMDKLRRTIRYNRKKGSRRALLYGKLVSEIIRKKVRAGITDPVIPPAKKPYSIAPFGKKTVRQTGFKFNKKTGEWNRDLEYVGPVGVELLHPEQEEEEDEDEDEDEDGGEDSDESTDDTETDEGEDSDAEGDQQDYSDSGEEYGNSFNEIGPDQQEQQTAEEIHVMDDDVHGNNDNNNNNNNINSSPQREDCTNPMHTAQGATQALRQIEQSVEALGNQVAAGFMEINRRLYNMEKTQHKMVHNLRGLQARVGIPLQDQCPTSPAPNSFNSAP